MMETNGMTAIVRGLPDSRLVVTLMDGGRQYTLMPQEEIKQTPSRNQNMFNNMPSRHSQYVSNDAGATRCDIGAQAVDERYASSYKMDYCHLRPTSPPVELTEFPPQRNQFHPGRGNFEVGGHGSGSHSPIRSKDTYVVSDRSNKGSSITTKDSMKSDAFTESLRKYPSVSPDSSEVVQRLYSYSKEVNSLRSNIFKLNECVNCYHATIANRSPQNSRKIIRKPKAFQEVSPMKNLTSYPLNRSRKQKKVDARLDKNKQRHFVRNSDAHRTRPVTSEMKDTEVVSNDAEYVKSFNDMTSSLLQENETLCNTSQETDDTLMNYDKNKSSSVRNVGTAKASEGLMEMLETEEKNGLHKRKKISPQLQLYTKCKKIKHKPYHVIGMNKLEIKNFKTEVVNLIKHLNDFNGDTKLEEKIKVLVNKLIESVINTETKLKEELLKYSTNNNSHITSVTTDSHTKYDCKNIATIEEALDEINKRFIFFWKNHLKQVSEIHRVITEEMLSIVKYVLKRNKNKVLESSVSKIFENIIKTFTDNENDIFVQQNNYLELSDPLCKEKFLRIRKRFFNIHKRSLATKCYLTSLRRLIKSETLHVINNDKKTHRTPKKFIDLTYRNIMNINGVFKNIKFLVPFQTEYVANMLLNQYCTTKQKENIYHQRTKNNILTVKCLSDTYILIHSTSRNKSILTQSKIDKMNLQHGTKLLASIKNNYESSMTQTQKNYKLSNCNNVNKQNTPKYVQENDMSPVLTSLPSMKKQYATRGDKKITNQKIYRDVEKKLDIWFSKFYTNLLPMNNKYRENISKCLTKEITDQLILLNMMKSICTIKSEYAEENLKNIICRHLRPIENNGNIKLVKKVSELVQDILNTRQATRLSATTSVENDTYKSDIPIISMSKSSQSIKNVLEDIYARVEFCDDDIRKMIVRNYMEEVEKNESNKDDNITDCYKEQNKYSHFSKNYNKSGIINVAVASANDNTSSNSSHSYKSNVLKNIDKTNQTENICAADNVAQPSSSDLNVPKKGSDGVTMQQLHEYCVDVFRKHCERLPILAITPELEDLARAGVLHNIMNTFSTLLKDPDIANDYTLFELYMEDDTDQLLDLLPQTEEIKSVRETWKIKLIMDATMLLKQIHKITDVPGFQQRINEKTSRRKLLQGIKRENDEAQELNALETAEEYIKFSNYHDPNPLVVRIYTQRLEDRINELYDMFKRRMKTSFLTLPVHELRDVIFRELSDVPKPNNNITREEIDLVNMNDEVANWYNELPVLKIDGIIDNIKRKNLIQTLAKKIYNMERHLDLDEPSVERNMKHEISMFLSNKATELQYEQDLNINSMVDKLTDRLRKKRQEKMLNYESFMQNLPASSTIVRHDIPCDDPHFSHQNSHMVTDNEHLQFDICNRPKNSTDENNVKIKPIAKTTAKGILGISQIPGPSTRDNLYSSPVHLKLQTQRVSEFSPRSWSPSRNARHSGQFYEFDQVGQITPTNNTYMNEQMPPINNRHIHDQMTPINDRYINEQITPKNNRFMNDQITPTNNRFITDQITPTNNRHINVDGRASTPYHGQNHNANDYSVIGIATRHSDDLDNFTPHDLRWPFAGRPIGTTSTRQVSSNRDRMNTYNVGSGKNRDPSKMRCLCADSQFQSRRRFTCCCQHHFSEDCCSLSPCDYFF